MERRSILVQGIVQGVGFRPFVYALATQLQLRGFVKNVSGSVLIEVEGEPAVLDRFLVELGEHPPELARMESISWQREAATKGKDDFRIIESEDNASGQIYLSPDVATCADCLAELFDPTDRRYLYPFLNCTNCGPRLTIIKGAPYDRQRTTMAGFPMCSACRAEYEDPANRRFHAQPTACPLCGPQLELLDAAGRPLALKGQALADFAEALLAAKIGALKGLGGYHLVCAAGNQDAVAELRRRKQRDEKPFAVMVADAHAAARLCLMELAEQALLESRRRPIVLLRKRSRDGVAEGVAPGNPLLGVMLPYTPLHSLLMRKAGDIPLVMTSGNRSDEPIAYRDEEATSRLKGIADLFLTHNRPIHVRCDDSVTRVSAGEELPLRRSRGYAPQPIALPIKCLYPILAVGGQLKGTFAIGREDQAFISHHLGDLDDLGAFRAFMKDVALYEETFALQPALLVHDMHPDYATTKYALQRANEVAIMALKTQHHHAHMASCMAENGLTQPVIGVTLDGTGYGTDGAIWGGEFLVGDYRSFQRLAHLRYTAMPGGEQAIRQPWRMALAYLADAQVECPSLAARISQQDWRVTEKILNRRFNTPRTSSAGRLFDAVSSLAGLKDRVSYEGQAAIELEWAAQEAATDRAYSFEITESGEGPLIVDTRPLIVDVVADVNNGVAAAVIARRFHSSAVEMIRAVCGEARRKTSLDTIVLSGGVFMNTLIAEESAASLGADGFTVYRHRRVPPNDGGLSLGQLAIGASQLCGPGLNAINDKA